MKKLKDLFSFNKQKAAEEDKEDDFLYQMSESLWMPHEKELQHQKEKVQFRGNVNSPVELGTVINTLFNIRKEDVDTLVVNDGNLKEFKIADEIWSYNMLNHYIPASEENEKQNNFVDGCSNLINQVVLTLSYHTYKTSSANPDERSTLNRDSILIIHLQTAGGNKEKAVYVQATFTKPVPRYERNFKGSLPQPSSFSILMTFDYEPREKLTKEMEMFVDSALEKIKEGKKLTYLEHQLLANGLRFPEYDFKSGNSALEQMRFWDALNYFKSAHELLKQKWWHEDLTDDEYYILFESAYKIGFCYMELKLFDKAYYYLEFAVKSNADTTNKYKIEFINCMNALSDIRTLSFVRTYRQELQKKKPEEFTANDDFFLQFLIRREAYNLIELKEYRSAEVLLKQILENDPENDFAINELEYLKKKKLI
jgi:tetratricopeptide (TPR) repeat protein